MSRIARVIRPGTLQYVISKFVDRDWFLASDEEREHYLRLFGRAMEQSDWQCVAYCLMSRELHFAMIAGTQPLDRWAKRVNSPFAQWLNKRRVRLGPIFADRPASVELPRDHALELVAHIHNIPVNANIVRCAGHSGWSSHRAYVGRARVPSWLDVGASLTTLGFENSAHAFDDAVRVRANSELELPELDRGRVGAREVRQLEPGAPRASDTIDMPLLRHDHVSPIPPPIATILQVVAASFELPTEALQRRYARGRASDAKRLAIHTATAVGVPIASAAAAMNLTRQRGSLVALTPLSPEERVMLDEIITRLRLRSAEER